MKRLLRFLKLFKLLMLGTFLAGSMECMSAPRFVSFEKGDLFLTEGTVSIGIDAADAKAVAIAAQTLAADFGRVTGRQAQVVNTADARILVGTIGKSSFIDQLVKQKKIDGSLLKGKREKYIITMTDGQLVIAGSDRRGTV